MISTKAKDILFDGPYDVAIIGAGIGGLSMAHYWAERGFKVLVLEKESRVGGSLHSYRLDGGFWLELGAHSCFNSYIHLLEILEQRGWLERLQGREKVGFKLWVDGALKSIPSQLRFGELLLSLPRIIMEPKTGRRVADYYGKIAGRNNYERVLAPAFSAVLCQPADDFPADFLFGRRPRRKDVLRSFTFPQGLQAIADALASRADVAVLTGQGVQSIYRAGDRFTLVTASGHYQARCLGLATPAPIAADLLGEVFPELAGWLARIQTATVETLGVVVRGEAVGLPPLAGIIARKDSFYSVVSRDTVADPVYRGFTFHFKPGLLDEAGKRRRVCQVLGVRPEQLEAVTGKHNRLPALRVGHGELIREVDRQLAGKPLMLTGNYFSGVSLEDCVTRSLREFLRLQGEPLDKPAAP